MALSGDEKISTIPLAVLTQCRECLKTDEQAELLYHCLAVLLCHCVYIPRGSVLWRSLYFAVHADGDVRLFHCRRFQLKIVLQRFIVFECIADTTTRRYADQH